jgi:rubrerythrin
MELGTFGAILSYALEFEGTITDFFTSAAKAASTGEAGEAFSALAKEGEKRLKVLERTRRENVAEMILEPIADFRSEDYPLKAKISAGASVADWVKQALAMETVAVKYYRMASEKVTVPEVGRVLKKMAGQHAEQKETLEAL